MNIPTTMSDQISDIKSTEITYRNLHPKATITVNGVKTISIPFSSMASKYKDFLSNIIVSMDLSEIDYNKYRYNPKRLSLDLYGTIELWDTILLINDCISVKDFTKHTIKYYDPSKLKQYLNEIVIIEEEIGELSIT